MKPAILLTKRLVLRRANQNDSENLFRNYHSNIDSSRFLTRKSHVAIEQTKEFLNEWCDLPWDNGYEKFSWVIALASTDEGIGVVLIELENKHSAQIHFGIGLNFTNQGLVTEAVREVVKWLLHQEDIERIWATCDLYNHGSKRVLEKLGFKREDILKKKLTLPAFDYSARDCYLYAYEK